MPQSYTYPGVYVEEIPSGVRTIAGVSTSDTAFVDFFPKGPLNAPVRITSFGDFQRVFGGLDSRSAASYAIQQYYLNGGSVAWVVRVAAGTGANAPAAASAAFTPANILRADATSPGAWANDRIRVSVLTEPTPAANRFNLRVEELASTASDAPVISTENYYDLSMDKSSGRYALNVVNPASNLIQLVRLSPDATLTVPTAPTGAGNKLGGGKDGFLPGSNDWTTTNGAAAISGVEADKTGMYALDKIAPFVFNILCLPGAVDLAAGDMKSVYNKAQTYAEQKRSFLIVDIPATVVKPADMTTWQTANGFGSRNAAVYFPRVLVPDPLQGNLERSLPSSGTIAGIYARIDAQRGVWKAPAGTEAWLRNATPEFKMTDLENGALNPLGFNAIRSFPVYNEVVWGARTLEGADAKSSEYKYVPVRRLALYLEESLYQGLKWVVFEPNDEPLWAQIRLNVGAFLNSLFRQGAFQGRTAREAYFVKCDRETTTQNDIDRGIVNIVVGFAPLKPAEFVVLKIQQIAGQLQV